MTVRLFVLAGGRLVPLRVCELCGAVTSDAELHRRWHETADRG